MALVSPLPRSFCSLASLLQLLTKSRHVYRLATFDFNCLVRNLLQCAIFSFWLEAYFKYILKENSFLFKHQKRLLCLNDIFYYCEARLQSSRMPAIGRAIYSHLVLLAGENRGKGGKGRGVGVAQARRLRINGGPAASVLCHPTFARIICKTRGRGDYLREARLTIHATGDIVPVISYANVSWTRHRWSRWPTTRRSLSPSPAWPSWPTPSTRWGY